MKRVLKIIGYVILTIVVLLLLLIGYGFILNYYEYNIKYSIAMPTILGNFYQNENWIDVIGVENIDNILTLNINETSCLLDKIYMSCSENRAVITRLGNQISIFPYYREYKIKYADNNKIIFEPEIQTMPEIIGEIDLNSKTLVYTIKSNEESYKKEIITDNKKIEELEKKIISKYLKVR